MEQLVIYSTMLKAETESEGEQIYQKWLKERFQGDWWTWDKRARQAKQAKL